MSLESLTLIVISPFAVILIVHHDAIAEARSESCRCLFVKDENVIEMTANSRFD